MGVNHDHYIIVGVKLEYGTLDKMFNVGEFEDLELDGVVNQWDAKVGDFVFISDGMNGEYDVVGKIIQKAEGDEFEGLEMIDCMAAFNKHKEEVRKKLFDLKIYLGPVSVFVFTHYH